MSKSYKYKPKSYETANKNKTYAVIYFDFATSDAFTDMSKSQRLMYIYMKIEAHGNRRPNRDFPKEKYPQTEFDIFRKDDVFYFNLAVATSQYALYTNANKRQFYKDVKAIIEHGFIKVVSSGRATKKRSIYQLSDGWKQWKKGKQNDGA